MRTLAAHSDKAPALRDARERQRDLSASILVSVERDYWKEPYSYRVVSFDLNDRRDRALIRPVGQERVNGVEVVMFARKRVFIVPAVTVPLFEPDLIGEYKARRARRRGREKVAA